MKRASKKWLSLVTSLAVAFVMCLGGIGMFAGPVYADPTGEGQIVSDLDKDAQTAVEETSEDPEGQDVSDNDGEGVKTEESVAEPEQKQKENVAEEGADVPEPAKAPKTLKGADNSLKAGDDEDESTEPRPDLTVSYNGTDVEFFYDSDANQMYYMNGEDKAFIPNVDQPIDYTAIKNTGSADPAEDAFGPTVLSMLGVAGLDPSALSDTSKLEVAFTASDGYATKFTWDELFGTERYSFPNAKRPGDPGDQGAAVTPAEKEGAIEVPVLYNLANEDENGEMDPQVCFGQVSPSERNKPNWPSAMMGDGFDKDGNPQSASISVKTVSSFKTMDNTSDENVNAESGTEIAFGSEINFGVSEDNSPYKGILYYTTDGSEPTQDSAIYNWYSYDKKYKDNPIVADKLGTLTIKTKVFRYDNNPSEVKTFTYTVRPNLIVSYDGTDIECFYDSEKNQMYYIDDENKEYIDNIEEPITYTAIKNTGSSDPAEDTFGPTVLDLLGVAGFDIEEIDDTSKLEVAFTASDGYAAKFAWDELFGTERYTFPNANRPGDPGDYGEAVEPEQKDGAVEVPVLYNLANVDENGEYDPQICFGQVSPSERNKPSWPKGMNGPGVDKNGNPAIAKISVSTVTSFKKTDNPSDSNVNVPTDTQIGLGSKIDFGLDEDNSPYKGILYYTTDGSEPTRDSAIYNWYSYDNKYKYNPIVADKMGTLTIKTKAFRYGNVPSDVKTFTYTVVPNLKVTCNGNEVEFFYDSDANQMYYMNGDNKEYIENVQEPITYTAIKNTGSSDPVEGAYGPAVLDILSAAGLDTAELDDTSKLEVAFTANDGYARKFTWDELFGTKRYSFPNANRPGDPGDKGAAVTDEEKVGAEEVPVLYNLANKNDNGEIDPQICFGQVSPSERNKPSWPRGMWGEGEDDNGEHAVSGISVKTVSSFKATDNPSDENVSVEPGSEITYGSEINFGGNESNSPYKGTLYYTIDGSEPTQDSAMYNWYSYNKVYKYNPIVVDQVGTFTVKTKAFRYDNNASEVDEFQYTVPSDLAANNAAITLSKTKVAIGTKPTVTVKIGDKKLDSKYYTASFSGIDKVGSNTAKVTVKAKDPFTGSISRTFSVTADLKAKSGAITLSKTKVTAGNKPSVSKVTIKNGKQTVTVSTKYYTKSIPSTKKVGTYKVTVKGKDLVTGTITKSFKVIPAKAVISKAAPGKKKVTVSIKSQKTSGVTKYQIKYKLSTSKTWKSVTTTSTKKVIKKLKSKKKYNIKVRAYGKTGYGAYSKVKTVTIK